MITRNILTSIIALLAIGIYSSGQEISPNLIGNNYWYPSSESLQMVMEVGNAIDTAGSHLIIFNVSGRIMIQEIISSDMESVNILNLEDGIYFVNIKNSSINNSTRLIVE